MNIKNATHSLTITEAPPFSFARDNRKDVRIVIELCCGISMLDKFSENSFYDTKVVLDGKYVKARMRLTDMYFMGYCSGTLVNGDRPKWFTFSEVNDTKKAHDPKFVTNSIKHNVDEDHYAEEFLRFTGQYTGGHSLMYTARKGGLDTNMEMKDLSNVILDKEKVENAFHTLYKSYESKNVEKLYPQIAWSSIIIAVVVSEAMRFEFVRKKIEDAWPHGYTLCDDSIFYIKHWVAGSVLVLANKGKADDKDIVSADDTDANMVKDWLIGKDIKKVGQLKEVFGLINLRKASNKSANAQFAHKPENRAGTNQESKKRK